MIQNGLTEIFMPYGDSGIPLGIPTDRLAGVLRPAGVFADVAGEIAAVKKALEQPIQSLRLKELVKGKSRIVILTSDHTRPMPSLTTLPLLLDEIRLGAPDADIVVLVATGAHRPSTEEELGSRFGDTLLGRARVMIHDPDDAAGLVEIGVLPSGARLRLNRTAVEADLLVAEGFIEPHFFAGFSGGRKSVLPGVAARTTVMANHCAAFIGHPSARTGVLDGNPIHIDMIAAAHMANLSFILNVVLDSEHRIAAAFSGEFETAHRAGCDWLKERAGVDPVFADIVVTTNGGHPLDRDIYQAVKSMTTAETCCKPGGVIIAMARCMDGHGAESFYHTFAVGDPGVELSPSGKPEPAAILRAILERPADATLMDQWQSQILARILDGHEVILVSDAPVDIVEAMGFHAASDPDTALRMAEQLLGMPDANVTVIPDGIGIIIKEDRR